MRDRVRITGGLRFVYWSERSDVCALVIDGAVVTVLTRALCRPKVTRFVPSVPQTQFEATVEPIAKSETRLVTAA